MSSRGRFLSIVSSFRYNGLTTLALAAFSRVRALRARCGPFGPAIVLKRGGGGCVYIAAVKKISGDAYHAEVFILSSRGL